MDILDDQIAIGSELDNYWQLFLGDDYEHYQPIWTAVENDKRRFFHFGALLFGGFWLVYRKQYLAAFIYALVFWLISFVDLLSFYAEGFPIWYLLFSHLYIGFSAYKNYYKHAQQHIQRIIQRVPNQRERLIEIQAVGGTTIFGVLGFVLLQTLLFFLIFFILISSVYHN